MYILLVAYNRPVGIDEGQAKLNYMAGLARQNLYSASGWQPMKVSGVTRFENPFPDWFGKMLAQAQFRYDDINMLWYYKTEHYEAGLSLLQWFEQQVRPWIASDPAWAAWMQQVTTRLNEDENCPDLVTY
jgi:hypothetical protein